jgi:hypothetical protein
MRTILVLFIGISFVCYAEQPCENKNPEDIGFDMRPKYILEAYELSDFKVHGVVLHGECSPHALMSDANGHIHRVFLGDYIGKHYGVVIDMGKMSVAIREVFEAENGEWEEKRARLWVDNADPIRWDNKNIQKAYDPYDFEKSNLVEIISTGKCAPYVLIKNGDGYINRIFLNNQITVEDNLVFTLGKESLTIEENRKNKTKKTTILNLDKCTITDSYFDIH